MATSKRKYDIVVFGATGFTGQLTAQYLAAHGGERLNWALAGRNPSKLESVRRQLAERRAPLHPHRPQPRSDGRQHRTQQQDADGQPAAGHPPSMG